MFTVLEAIQMIIGIMTSLVGLYISIKNLLPNKKRKTATRNGCNP